MSNALSRKCAYYFSLIWHEGIAKLDRQQKETVLLLAISLLTTLFSSITIVNEKSSRKRYQPQSSRIVGGKVINTYGFGTKPKSVPAEVKPNNVGSTGRSKIHQSGEPLTKQEEQLLQQLLQKQRTAKEAELFFGVK